MHHVSVVKHGIQEAIARVDIAGHSVSGDEFLRSILEPGHRPRPLHLGPVSVRAGVPFDVIVYTFINPYCTEGAPSEIGIQGRVVTVTPHDLRVKDSVDPDGTLVLCPSVLSYLPRTDRVVFDTPGEAEVVVRGARYAIPYWVVNAPPHPERHLHPLIELRFPVIVTE